MDLAKPGDRITVTGVYKATGVRTNPRLRELKVQGRAWGCRVESGGSEDWACATGCRTGWQAHSESLPCAACMTCTSAPQPPSPSPCPRHLTLPGGL